MKPFLKNLLLLMTLVSFVGCSSVSSDAQPEETEVTSPPVIEETPVSEPANEETEEEIPARLLYLGHASLRIITPEGKVIYIDPYAPGDYSEPADLVLITHDHYDHTALDLIENKADDYTLLTNADALKEGEHQTFELGYVTVRATQAGNNPNHSIESCVGYVLTLSNGIRIYISGDTSMVPEMADLLSEAIDYAFFCCDGVYNMNADEAGECADLVGAKHNIPYHVIPPEGTYFSRERAEAFSAENRMILEPGEEIDLVKE